MSNLNGMGLPDSLAPLAAAVHRELERVIQSEPNRRPALEEERTDLQMAIDGWSLSLAKPDLAAAVRQDIEIRYADAKARIRELETAMAALDGQDAVIDQFFDENRIAARLAHLDEVLRSDNVTLGNLELSRHIDRIDIFADGRVVLRTTKLGLFDGVSRLLARSDVPESDDVEPDGKRVKPRLRGRLRIDEPAANANGLYDDDFNCLDPNRFAGLDPQWFWVDTFTIPEPTYWALEHAEEVVKRRAEGMTFDQLVDHFGKTAPTIRKAIKIGAAAFPELELPRKIPRPNWAQNHAVEVLALQQQGLSTDEIAAKFQKSDTTIRTALRLALEAGHAAQNPDSVGERITE